MVFSLSVIEREIAEAASRIGLRLRFDKVAMRVIGALRESLSDSVADNEAVLFTLTAPIRLPAKMAAGMNVLVQGNWSGARVRYVLHGNYVCLRGIRGVQADMPKVIGLVHNPEVNAELLLDLAEARLTASDRLAWLP